MVPRRRTDFRGTRVRIGRYAISASVLGILRVRVGVKMVVLVGIVHSLLAAMQRLQINPRRLSRILAGLRAMQRSREHVIGEGMSRIALTPLAYMVTRE